VNQNPSEITIPIIGGTGALGSGLAKRWAKAGVKVVIGSRDAGRAADADYAVTIVRNFLFSSFQALQWEALAASADG